MERSAPPSIDWGDLAAIAMDGMAVADGETFVRVNRAFASAYGYDAADALTGEPWHRLYEPEECDRLEQALSVVREAGKWRGEATGLRADGSTFPQRLSLGTTDAGCVVWCVRDASDRRAREREIARYEAIVETVQDGVYALDGDLQFSLVNEALCELVGFDAEEVLGRPVSDFFAYDDEYAVAEEIRERVVAGDTSVGTAEGTAIRRDDDPIGLETRYRLHPPPDDEFEGSVGVIRDVEDRTGRERTLARQRDQMAALVHLNGLQLDVLRELVETSSREAIERAVCRRLAESGLYEFAAVGERELDGDGIEWRVRTDDRAIEAVDLADDGVESVAAAAARAVRDEDVGVVSVAGEPSIDRPVDASGRSRDAVAAIPLATGGAVFGVLVVRADRPDACGDRERHAFGVLGRAIGFAIEAIETKQLLFADSTVELEFDVGGTTVPLVRVADGTSRRISLPGYVATGDGSWLAYVEVEGADAEEVARALEDRPHVDGVRVVRDGGDGGTLEVALDESSFLGVLVGMGAKVATVVATESEARLTVQVAASADVRDVVARVQHAYPGAELVARRDRDRTPWNDDRRSSLLDRLTDRQRQVVEVAYRAGYFDWPRESTGQDLAGALDVAPATLHAHLRKAEHRLLSALLD